MSSILTTTVARAAATCLIASFAIAGCGQKTAPILQNSFSDLRSLENEVLKCQQTSDTNKILELFSNFEKAHQNGMDREPFILFNDRYVKALLNAGKLEDADERARTALRDAERKYGEYSPDVQSALLTCLGVAEVRGQRERKDELFNRLISICEKSGNKFKQMMVLTQWESQLSFSCGEVFNQHRLDKLNQLNQELLPPGHPRIPVIRLAIARNLANAKRFKESENAFKTLLTDLKSGSNNDTVIIGARTSYGKLLFQQNRDKDAMEEWAKALPLVESDPQRLNEYLELLSDLGFVHYRKDHFKEALPYYQKAGETLEKQRVFTGPVPEDMFVKYIKCLAQCGKNDKASKVRALIQKNNPSAFPPA